MIRQFFILFLIQIKLFRQVGLIAIVISAGLPLCLVFFLKLAMPQILSNSENLLFFITGNFTLSIMTVCVIMLGQTISSMKQIKSFEYFAVLPVNKLFVIFSIILSFFVISLPGFILILVTAPIILNFQFAVHPLFFLVIVLSIFSLSGLGGLLGVYTKNIIQTNLFSQIIGFGAVMITPVFYPIEILPLPLRIISLFFPTTYMADAFRYLLKGTCNNIVLFDILILFCFSMLSFYVITKKIVFREE